MKKKSQISTRRRVCSCRRRRRKRRWCKDMRRRRRRQSRNSRTSGSDNRPAARLTTARAAPSLRLRRALAAAAAAAAKRQKVPSLAARWRSASQKSPHRKRHFETRRLSSTRRSSASDDRVFECARFGAYNQARSLRRRSKRPSRLVDARRTGCDRMSRSGAIGVVQPAVFAARRRRRRDGILQKQTKSGDEQFFAQTSIAKLLPSAHTTCRSRFRHLARRFCKFRIRSTSRSKKTLRLLSCFFVFSSRQTAFCTQKRKAAIL